MLTEWTKQLEITKETTLTNYSSKASSLKNETDKYSCREVGGGGGGGGGSNGARV